MKRDNRPFLLFVGVALFVIGMGIIASPVYRTNAEKFTKYLVSKASNQYSALYVLQHTVGTKVQITQNRYFAVVLYTDFINAVSPKLISIDNKLYPVSNKVVYAGNNFLQTGVGYLVFKLDITGVGQAEIIAKATLDGNNVNVQPLYGVVVNTTARKYLVAVPGAGFTFKSYKRVTVEIKPFFVNDYPADPVTGEPINVLS